ncbi:MAG TPA: formate dehydrogenase accessory protein FdhE [Terriglobales bacterium]
MRQFSWDEKILRAEKLAQQYPATSQFLQFYGRLAAFQKYISQNLNGSSDSDIRAVLKFIPELNKFVAGLNSDSLNRALTQLGSDQERWTELLLQYWQKQDSNGSAAEAFLAYSLIQPYAQHVTSRMKIDSPADSRECPACGNLPQLAVLREYSNGAKRSLICFLCGAEWEFRRVLCPNCGEQHKDKLPVYTADEFQQARIEACDNCTRYIKCIDMSKDGRAVPQVDDLATLALDLWAEEQGYTRPQPNVLLLSDN